MVCTLVLLLVDNSSYICIRLVLLVEYIVCALVLLVVDYSSYLLLSEAPLVCREFDCCTSPSRN